MSAPKKRECLCPPSIGCPVGDPCHTVKFSPAGDDHHGWCSVCHGPIGKRAVRSDFSNNYHHAVYCARCCRRIAAAYARSGT